MRVWDGASKRAEYANSFAVDGTGSKGDVDGDGDVDIVKNWNTSLSAEFHADGITRKASIDALRHLYLVLTPIGKRVDSMPYFDSLSKDFERRTSIGGENKNKSPEYVSLSG